jgi:hypothetical protein
LVKCLHEFRGVILAFESSERTRGLVASFPRQPLPRFALIAFLQERIHKDTVNVKGLHAVFASQLRGLAAKLRQGFVLCRRCAICFGADGKPVEIESFREQSSVAQPDSVSPAKVAANGRDFDLEFAVVVPVSLNSRALVMQSRMAGSGMAAASLSAQAVKSSRLHF